MPVCFVQNCKNSSRKRRAGVTFHRIPTKYRLEWLRAINRPADTFLSNQRVCSEHFSATDFLSCGERRRLKDEAVPFIKTMQSIDETCMKSESIDPLSDTHSIWLPEQREEAIASKSSESIKNNSSDQAVMLKEDDFGKICRCCLSNQIMANILYLKFGETFFVDIIFKLLGTEVNSSDGLPKNICAACVAALINFYNFQQKYNNSLATLLSALRENEGYSIQNDIANEDIKEELSDISIFKNELDEESQNENINKNDNPESTIFEETKEPESMISDDPNKILLNDDALWMLTNESFNVPQLEDDTENEQFHMENSELDEKLQYESNENENINDLENNESTTYLSPQKHKQTLPRLCKICETWIIGKEHKCSTNTKSSYVCDICGQRFLQNASLQVHYRIHKLSLLVNQISDENGVSNSIPDTIKEKRTCSCGEIFYTSKDFSQHKKEKNHLDPLDKKCEICNKIVPTRGLVKHMREAHNLQVAADVKIDCSTCGKTFKTRKALTQHLKIHGEKNFLCSYCGKRFYYASRFKTHCLGHTGEKPFSCNVCGQKFRSSRNLTSHMYIHTGKKPYVCKFCPKAFRQIPHLRAHLRTHTGEKPYNCPYCDKSFAHDTTRSVHIRTHTGERPYACDICGESFTQKGSMMVHRRLHTGEKPYLCDHCGETFSSGNTYRNHLAVKHQQKINSEEYDADLHCKICDKFYSSKPALKIHMCRHEEKKNLCTYCGKGFYTKASLDAHSVVHTGEKKFSCGLCGKKFGRLLSYKQHQYIHNGQKPYTCKICSKDFRQSAHLVSHMRIHTGEKPYGCPYCDKTFAHFTTRIVHVRSHTGETPYVCDVCSKGFSHSSTMTKHRQRHFKKESTESADCDTTD